MADKVMQILADVTGGKNYKAHKYGLDHAERPFIDYGEDSIVWQKTAETEHIRQYVDLTNKSKQVALVGDQLLTYFLDGSRRVFKVDDIAYQQSGRSVIYPVISGQIGVVTDETMKKLSEINIRPLRIAFDHYEQKDIYIKAIRTAAKYGIKDLSNYLLYNFLDKPDDLYYRMRINVDLCEELGVTIYSFPMKYHPIDDPDFFRNRDYIGKHWCRKFIRAVQAVLNATKGKIGKGKDFFEEAFGRNINEFYDILWMPETFIIFRMKYKDNLTAEWRTKFQALSPKQEEVAKRIIAANDFSEDALKQTKSEKVLDVLEYYRIARE